MSDRKIEYGSDEHLANLTRQVLEAEFKGLLRRNRELENECMRLCSGAYSLPWGYDRCPFCGQKVEK